MDAKRLIDDRVHEYYWTYDWNCAKTTLKILSELFEIDLADQVLQAAAGLDGAGRYGAQCGLVEGALMFIGITGAMRGLTDQKVEEICYSFAESFERRFGSLLCSVLRPEGFRPDNPPHLCENLSQSTVLFAHGFLKECFRWDAPSSAG